jgi:hypothetical protein
MEKESPGHQYFVNKSTRVWLNVVSDIRGEGSAEAKINLELHPDICQIIVDLFKQKNSPANSEDSPLIPVNFAGIPPEYIEPLIKARIIVEAGLMPNNIRFKCVLDQSGISTLPENDLKRNPFIFLQTGSYLPSQIKKRIQYNSCFSEELPVLWVEDPDTKMLMPFWFSDKNSAVIQDFLSGKIAINELGQDILLILKESKIILPVNENEPVFSYGLAKKELEEKGYTIKRNILNPLQIRALKKYYHELEQKGYYNKGDKMVRKRDSMPDEPTAKFVHHQLLNFINRLTPEKVQTSFCFSSIYQPGVILERHTDRKQCAWNISLVLDMEPETETSKAWPLFIEKDGIVNEVRLGIGDAVVYQGTKVPHWREKLAENNKYFIFFFHFVPEDFSGSLK